MKVYRVYRTFHETDGSESGTWEYGIFDDRSRAMERAKEVAEEWNKNEWQGTAEVKVNEKAGWVSVEEGWDSDSFIVREYEVNEAISQQIVGYT